jgi:uncharacterized protein
LRKYPTKKETLKFLKRVGCNKKVIEHCIIVSEYAVEIAKACKNKIPIDMRLIEIGALMHDVGRAITNDVRHAILGATLVRAAGYSEDLANLVERHVGAGIPIKEARKIKLPVKSYMPKSIEEKIVSYADKLVRGKRRTTVNEAVEEISQKLGSKHPAVKRFRNLHEEISRLMSG